MEQSPATPQDWMVGKNRRFYPKPYYWKKLNTWGSLACVSNLDHFQLRKYYVFGFFFCQFLGHWCSTGSWEVVQSEHESQTFHTQRCGSIIIFFHDIPESCYVFRDELSFRHGSKLSTSCNPIKDIDCNISYPAAMEHGRLEISRMSMIFPMKKIIDQWFSYANLHSKAFIERWFSYSNTIIS